MLFCALHRNPESPDLAVSYEWQQAQETSRSVNNLKIQFLCFASADHKILPVILELLFKEKRKKKQKRKAYYYDYTAIY